MEKIIGRIATFIIFALCFMFVIRCCMVADKSEFSNLYITDGVRSAYADGESEVKTVKVEREIADDGYFSAYAFFYVPETGEIQVTVRWNDSAYEYTSTEQGYEFAFHLLNETTGEKYPATVIDTAKKSIYNYRKLVAKDVDLGEAERLTVVLEVGDGYESKQIIRYAEQPLLDYKLPSKLQKELGLK